MMDFPNIIEILDFFIANLGIPDKSMIPEMIPGFLGYLSFLEIPEMIDFPNILEIIDFLIANLGNPDKSMISARFSKAKPFENRNFPPRNFSPRPEKNGSGEKFLGEKLLGGNVSGGKGFRSVLDSRDFPDFWDSSASWISRI